MKKVYRYVRKYGIGGLVISTKLKTGNTNRISVPGIPYPIRLRKDTSDIPTFHHIFNAEEYDINLDFEPKTIIDAGANVGLAAIYFANKYPNAKIISIEPERSNFDLLEENTRHYKNVYPIRRALSNQADQYLDIVDNGFGKWGFMTEEKKDATDESKEDLVQTITIDEIIKENELDVVDIVKIDIEGAEKELFENNYDNWITKSRCIIVELHDRMKKGTSKSFFSAISKYDFSFSQQRENLIFINDDEKLLATQK